MTQQTTRNQVEPTDTPTAHHQVMSTDTPIAQNSAHNQVVPTDTPTAYNQVVSTDTPTAQNQVVSTDTPTAQQGRGGQSPSPTVSRQGHGPSFVAGPPLAVRWPALVAQSGQQPIPPTDRALAERPRRHQWRFGEKKRKESCHRETHTTHTPDTHVCAT